MVKRLVFDAEKSKPSGLSPFLFLLYESKELLREREATLYKATEVMMVYEIKLDSEAPKKEEVNRNRRVNWMTMQ